MVAARTDVLFYVICNFRPCLPFSPSRRFPTEKESSATDFIGRNSKNSATSNDNRSTEEDFGFSCEVSIAQFVFTTYCYSFPKTKQVMLTLLDSFSTTEKEGKLLFVLPSTAHNNCRKEEKKSQWHSPQQEKFKGNHIEAHFENQH